jgi:hypothetical protein
MLDVLTSVAGREPAPDRISALERHAALVLQDGERTIATPSDLGDLRARHALFAAVAQQGPLAYVNES